jgi:hypothetical protein
MIVKITAPDYSTGFGCPGPFPFIVNFWAVFRFPGVVLVPVESRKKMIVKMEVQKAWPAWADLLYWQGGKSKKSVSL